MFNHGWWRLAVGGDWRLLLATSGWWRLVVVGGSWQLMIGGWWRLVVVGGWRLVAAGGWRQLVAVGGWRLVAPWGGPEQNKISFLKDHPVRNRFAGIRALNCSEGM